MEEKLTQILAEEGFVEKLMRCETPEQVQSLFGKKGLDLTLEEIRAISQSLTLEFSDSDELDEDALDAVAGGTTYSTAFVAATISPALSAAMKKLDPELRRAKLFFRRW